MQFEGLISRVYMFFGTGSPNLWSILKPEVELMVLLRMRSDKITKNCKNARKMQFEGIISRVYMFFGTGSPNLWTIWKPEVAFMVFVRMRSDKITKNGEKCPQNAVVWPNFPCIYVFRSGESEFVVRFETESTINGVSAHAP